MKSKSLSAYLFIYFAFLFIGFLVFFPIIQKNLGLANVYNDKRLANICLVLLLIFPFLFKAELQHRLVKVWKKNHSYVRISLILILVFGLISTFFAEFPLWALVEITQLCLLFILVLIVAVFVQEYPSLTRKLLLFISVGFAGLFLFQLSFIFFDSYISVFPNVPRIDTFVGAYSFVNIRFFNQVQTVTLPLLGAAVISIRKYNRSAGILSFLILASWWFLVFVSGARGTLLASITGILLAGIFIYRSTLKWLLVQLFGLVLGATGYFLLYGLPGDGTGRNIARSGSTGRLEFWLKTILETIQQPILGYGPMQSSIHGLGLHGHNYFITMSYEWGIPAALLFSIILTVALYSFVKHLKNEKEYLNKFEIPFYTGILASLIAIWIHSLFSDLFKTPSGQIWMVLIIGYAVGFYCKFKNEDSIAFSKVKYNWSFSAFVISVILIFVWSVYPTAINLKKDKKEYINQFEPKFLYPRFWQQGKIGWKDKEKNRKIIQKHDIQ